MPDLCDFPITEQWLAVHLHRIPPYSLTTPNVDSVSIMREAKSRAAGRTRCWNPV